MNDRPADDYNHWQVSDDSLVEKSMSLLDVFPLVLTVLAANPRNASLVKIMSTANWQ